MRAFEVKRMNIAIYILKYCTCVFMIIFLPYMLNAMYFFLSRKEFKMNAFYYEKLS